MSVRFTANFTVLLAGAGLVVCAFAFSLTTLGWLGVGVGAVAIGAALTSFAVPHQGVYQRVADVLICAVGAWAIVAARVMPDGHRWLEFAAGIGLAGLGGLGLVVREAHLSRGLQVGESRIGPDQFAHMSSLQRDAGARS
jgi:hypothetical protein